MLNIKKRILSGLVVGTMILLPGMKGNAELRDSNSLATNNKEVVVYNRDDFNSDIIGNLIINQEFIRIMCCNNLDLINYHNHLGYIDKSSIEINYDYPTERSYQEIEGIGYVQTEINFRVGPGTEFDIIEKIPSGSEVKLIAQSDNGWYLVDYNNTIGFVSMKYTKKINMEEIYNQVIKLPTIYKVALAKTEVNVREYPNTDSKIITTMKENEKIPIIKLNDSGWYQCLYNDNIVYVCGDYIKETYDVNGDYYKIVYLNKETNAYDYPFGNIIGYIPRYEMAFVYGETDDFYLIEIEGKVGFVKKIYCVNLKNRFVVVDISSQTMKVYNGLEEILSSDVVTGKNETPTHLGIYSIDDKERDRYLVGPDYRAFVKYWMPFNGGEGLHDASKRNSFGGNIYHRNGSHGCVNLPSKVAKKLFSEISVGDKVLIKK